LAHIMNFVDISATHTDKAFFVSTVQIVSEREPLYLNHL